MKSAFFCGVADGDDATTRMPQHSLRRVREDEEPMPTQHEQDEEGLQQNIPRQETLNANLLKFTHSAR